MDAVEILAPVVGTAAACEALTISRASLYRRRSRQITVPRRRPTPPRALSPVERETVRDVLHSERFVDKAPAEVVATLLDEDVYHCSTRTMYRVLDENREVRERRDQLRHPIYQKPELRATAPQPGLVLGHHEAPGAR